MDRISPELEKLIMMTNMRQTSRRLVIVGAGGFGTEAAWVAEDMNAAGRETWQWHILGLLDDDPRKHGTKCYGYPILGSLATFETPIRDEPLWYFCAIANPDACEKVAGLCDARQWQPATLIHPSAVCAKDVDLAPGCYIGPNTVVSTNCRIGRHAIVNHRAALGHDAVVMDYANICPGAQINGHCVVGRGALVGSNSSLHQGSKVGDYASVGSNSMVIRPVAERTSVLGIPARVIRAA